jgi:2'-5' RNA ligase
VRVFLALPVAFPAARELRRRAQKAAGPSTSVRFTAERHMHITLFFFGDREQEFVDELGNRISCWAEGLRSEAGGSRQGVLPLLDIKELAVYPKSSGSRRLQPRVLVGEISRGSAEIAALYRQLLPIIEAQQAGIRTVRFRPHVTAGRWGRSGGSGEAAELDGFPIRPPVTFSAQELVLYRSVLNREGASYDRLFTVELSPWFGRKKQ